MYILTVIPISRGISKEQLSYFSSQSIPVGALVNIPLRSKNKPALVVDSRTVSEAKTEIRKADHSLKKINHLITEKIFEPETVGAIRTEAEWFATTSGAMIHHLAPTAVLSAPEDYFQDIPINPPIKNVFERFLLQASFEDRTLHYTQVIRESFSQRSSVMILTPTKRSAQNIAQAVSRGIETFVFCLHSGLNQAKIKSLWKQAQTENHPVVLVITPGFLMLPRADLSTLILEEEGNDHYQTFTRPVFSIQQVAEKVALKNDLRFIVSDIILRSQTIWRFKQGYFNELSTLSLNTPIKAKTEVIDMRKTDSDSPKESELQFMFSDQLLKQISSVKSQKQSLFLFSNQRSLAPTLVCSDCGQGIVCPQCSSGLSLQTQKGERLFVCSVCNFRGQTFDQCSNCQGHRIAQLGIGTERVEQAISSSYSDLPIYRIDSTVTTDRQADQVAERFLTESDGSILIGTEMALNHLPPKAEISTVAVVSLDSLLSRPDFAMHEKIFRLLVKLRSLATDNFILQSRMPESPLLEYIRSANTRHFYQDDITLRQRFNYPPFSVLIKITISDTPNRVETFLNKLTEGLKAYSPLIYPAITKAGAGKKSVNLLIKVPESNWIDPDLYRILSLIPQKYQIAINPANIL